MNLNKDKIKAEITLEQNFNLVQEFGGNPIYTSFGFIAETICHNPPGEGSMKLYYYANSNLYHCFTACGESFDIFQLIIKVFEIQRHMTIGLLEAMRFLISKLNISYNSDDSEFFVTDEWKIFEDYEKIHQTALTQEIQLKEYDEKILKCFNYNVQISPWIEDGISPEVLKFAHIGFYPGGDQITIPHYDINNRFIGLRGRTLCKQEAELFGKYRPLKINNILYSHPLGLNLYGLNWNKENIKAIKKAIIFESEKSVLQYSTLLGQENNIAVACCGFSISQIQIELLLKFEVSEIIIALDRQFQNIGDDEFKKLKTNLLKLHERYHSLAQISFIFDKEMLTPYKSSPIENGLETFMYLFKNRILL